MTNELLMWQILPLVLGVTPYPWDRESKRHLEKKWTET